MQKDLDKLSKARVESGLRINIGNTKSMAFGLDRKQTNNQFWKDRECYQICPLADAEQ